MIKRILKRLFCRHVWEWEYEMTWTRPNEEKVCLGCHCVKCGLIKETNFFRKKD